MARILFVKHYHYTRFTGGAEEQSWLLATEFAQRGWDVHYASEMNDVPKPHTLEGVTLHGLPENPPYLRGNRASLRKLMIALQPDVVYSRSFDIYTRDAVCEAPSHTVTIWASAMSGDGFIWPRLRELRRVTPLPLFLKRLPIHYSILRSAKIAVRRATLVFVQRHDQIVEFRRRSIQAYLVRNVQREVPEDEVQTHIGRPVVLWAASLKSWKRPEAFVELARRCRDLDAEFVLIGALQDPHYADMIAAAVREIPSLRWDGSIPLSRVGQYFARAHLFVNTSVPLEGYPNSFIHAWLHGVPVVSLDVDPENLLSQKGLGIKANSMNMLEQAVRDLITDPDRRRTIGEKARAYALHEHNLERTVDHIEQLLLERGVQLPAQKTKFTKE